MNQETASKMNVMDIKAFGPAPDERTLSALLGRLADLASEAGDLLLWGWLCTIRDMPDEIAEEYDTLRLETVRDEMRRKGKVCDADAIVADILDAAVTILRRP